MVNFSKPIQESDNEALPRNSRKHTLNPKLTSADNVNKDAAAIKRRKLNEAIPSTSTATKPSSRQPSIEEVDDKDLTRSSRGGRPRNPNAIIELADRNDIDGSDDEQAPAVEENDNEITDDGDDEMPEITAEKDLSNFFTINDLSMF